MGDHPFDPLPSPPADYKLEPVEYDPWEGDPNGNPFLKLPIPYEPIPGWGIVADRTPGVKDA